MRKKAGIRLSFGLLLAGLIIISYTITSACQYDMCLSSGYGELSENSLSITREIHQYSYAAQAGDRIIIRINRTSGTLEPRLALYSPDGSLVRETGTGAAWAQLLDIYMEHSGTYRFLCMDGSGPGRGDYAVSLQSTNRPANVETITFDDVVRDTISMYSQMKAYRFLADAGEAIMVQAISIEGGLDPRIELFDPNGARIGSAVDNYEAVLIVQSLSTSGYQTVLMSDDRAGELGSYFLLLHRLPLDADENPDALPGEFSLKQNYPNPFNPSTSIQFSIPKSSFVKIDIFNVLGEKVKNLSASNYSAGSHTVVWDSKDENGAEVASGIYYYMIKAGDFIESKKMVLLK
ncbi:MAG: T9SS type A sorting domain-containing protein [candidate division Zixibacteria bacterium]|nr:T9SS type A sorting domain-containing protein [candidate division Zixibacteria bacterium]